jgi:GTP-binding protein
MNFKRQLAHTEFFTSASSAKSLPADEGCEIAFAGRSNAGKSSAINTLCQQKGLARTSKTPGRTQLINFFTINKRAKLADLPGYGYAKASQNKQRQWLELLEYYFTHRQALKGTIIVMDIRHPLRDSDQKMIDWCMHYQCPIHVLLNKADKLSRNQARKQLLMTHKRLPSDNNIAVSMQLFSALSGEGIDEAINQIQQWVDRK